MGKSDARFDQRRLRRRGRRDAFDGAPAPDRLGRNKGEGNPDEQKSNEMLAGEGLVINKEAEKEADTWGEILKKTDGDQPQMSRGVAKPHQRNSGDDPGGG